MRLYTWTFRILGLPGLRWVYPLLKRCCAAIYNAGAFSAHAKTAEEDALWYRSKSYDHLREMIARNRVEGGRVFIMGNGPSLEHMDLDRLKGEYTMGTNRVYLLFQDRDWMPSFYLCCNEYVIQQSVDEIRSFESTKILSNRAMHYLKSDQNTAFVRSLFPHRFLDGFSRDVLDGWNEGSTVTYCCLQLAYTLGFREAILIGVDHSYSASALGSPHQVVRTGKPDCDHFSSRYFGPQTSWQLPDLAGSEQSYRVAKRIFEDTGRRVIDATVGGQLQIFPKVPFDQLF